MGIGTSVFLIAVGAIMEFALRAQVTFVNIKTVGLILMIVGGIGIVLSLVFWQSWGSGSYRRSRVRRTSIDSYGHPIAGSGSEYVEEDRRY